MSEPATVTASAQPRRQSASREAGLRRWSLAPIGGGHSGLLDASIRRISSVLSEPSPEHWAIRTPGMRRIASVDLSAGWLSLSMSLRQLKLPINLKIIGSMLSRNARMDGSCRIVAQRQHGRRQIVADLPAEILPWDCETGLDTLIGGTIAGLDAAVSPNAQHGSPISEAGLPREPVSHEQMEAMFDEAGWPAQPGEDERLEIPLEVPGTYHAASVEHDSASICLSVPILPVELAAAPCLCRDAVTVLLWFTSSRLRMVKATRSRRVLSLEVALPAAQADAIGLAHACAALSAALQRCSAEAGLLAADEGLAKIYLSKLTFNVAVRNQPFTTMPNIG